MRAVVGPAPPPGALGMEQGLTSFPPAFRGPGVTNQSLLKHNEVQCSEKVIKVLKKKRRTFDVTLEYKVILNTSFL